MLRRAALLCLAFALTLPLGCGEASAEPPRGTASGASSGAPSGDGGDGAGGGSPGAAQRDASVAVPGTGPRVVFLGDSITAGLHLPSDEAFPAVLGRLLAAEGRPIRVQAAGQSGDTSAGGLRRADWVLEPPPDILVVELGANDALRVQPVENITDNLRQIIRKGKAVGAEVLLLGMRIPTSYGPVYANGFAELYEVLADEEDVALVPFFMAEAVNTPGNMLSDGLHPSASGHEALARTVLPHLRELLDALPEDAGS